MKTKMLYLSLMLLAASAFAGLAPTQITYQGTLKQGGAAANGTHTMVFSITKADGTVIYSEQASVPVNQGLFSYVLSPTNVDWQNVTPYIHVTVDGQALEPPEPITSTAYALMSQSVVDGAITQNKLATSLQSQLMPAGVVVAFTGETAPSGWLLCDGTAISRTDYAGLFSVIGISHGGGNGTTTFNLPDYRGFFLRGEDHDAGRDPDTSTRTAMNPGGNTADAVGSVQGVATHLPTANPFMTTVSGAHTHQYLRPGTMGGNQAGSNQASWVIAVNEYGTTGNPQGSPDGAHQHGIIGGDSETRPVNAYVNYIIKY